jgi:hypothetical protein
MKVNDQLHILAALSQAKEAAVPFVLEAGWASEPVLTFLKKECSLLLPRT